MGGLLEVETLHTKKLMLGSKGICLIRLTIVFLFNSNVKIDMKSWSSPIQSHIQVWIMKDF